MFDIGGSELIIIFLIALFVVGPQKLPQMMRTVGQWVAKARGMAREFQRSMDDAAREADIADLRKITSAGRDIKSATDPTAWLNKTIKGGDSDDEPEENAIGASVKPRPMAKPAGAPKDAPQSAPVPEPPAPNAPASDDKKPGDAA